MTATVDGVTVTGTPEEIAEFIKLTKVKTQSEPVQIPYTHVLCNPISKYFLPNEWKY